MARPGPGLFALALTLAWLPMNAATPGTGVLAEGGTGKVPVEGALTANRLSAAPGDVVYLYFNATALTAPDVVQLQITLPAGVEIVGDGKTQEKFTTKKPGESVGLALAVRVVTPGEKKVLARATLHDSPDFVESRVFTLSLGPAPPPGK